ncbi:MAG: thiamine pyrophosphate-binding protein [Acidimicrobiales bacterium]|nr:thiamine pyrophosphate-binding protein [Acidimicrobiales bacterium]
MSTVNGGELVARTLYDLGVRTAFGIHGGHLDAMLVSMADLGIRLVDTRHEAAAGHAADGYARATGGLGVAFATAGPGFTNIYTALASAHLDRVPLLVLTSSPPQREAELNVLQGGLDQLAAARPVSRWVHRVTSTSRIPDLVCLAVRHALCGVPGPVVLELPIDVLFREVAPETVSAPTGIDVEPPGPSQAAVRRLVELLRGAERPLLVVGGGAARSVGATDALVALLDRARIPVCAATKGHGVVPPGHPCDAGGPVEMATIPFLAGEPDVVVLLGARRGMFLGSRGHSMIPADAAVVHVDLDPAEPGRIGRPELAVTADVAELCRALAGVDTDWPDWSEWLERTHGARGAHAMLYADAPELTASGRIHPYVAAREVAAAIGPDPTVVFDGGESSGWINFFARARRPGRWVGIGYLGGLGVGPGFAIGAQVAHPGERVVLVSGDGALGFNLPELDTMLRHELPIVTVVFNNTGWGMSLHGQQLVFGEKTHVVVDLPDTRYDRIAEGFGAHGERVERPEDIAPAIERALAAGRPALVDIAVAPDVTHPIMNDLGQPVPEGHIRIPYYESMPLGEG